MFIDEEQVANLEKKMNERGYLEGSEMAGTFNLLRANDLIWSFVVNNYLLGKDPFPFDLLYWNADSTRMPARMHSFYLRNMYIKNLLGQPGGIELDGVPIDLGKVNGAVVLHLHRSRTTSRPGRATYKGADAYLGGPVRFVLGGSGPHRRHRQPAGGEQVPLLGQRRACPRRADAWFRRRSRSRARGGRTGRRWIDRLNGGEKVPARAAKRPRRRAGAATRCCASPKTNGDDHHFQVLRDAKEMWI